MRLPEVPRGPVRIHAGAEAPGLREGAFLKSVRIVGHQVVPKPAPSQEQQRVASSGVPAPQGQAGLGVPGIYPGQLWWPPATQTPPLTH